MAQHKPENGNNDAAALRQALVDDLVRQELIRSAPVEQAFRVVPRHLFVPDRPLEEVYADRSLPTKVGPQDELLSTSSQPAMMAIMLEQLGLQAGHRVLEIGGGTGYNAALLAHIVGPSGQVFSVDIDAELVARARENLAAAGLGHAQAVCADGGYGYPDAAPYDRVLLTVGAPDLLPAWIAQLRPGGRLVLPLGINSLQLSIAFEESDTHLHSLSVFGCGFMALRGDFADPAAEALSLGPEPGLMLRGGQQPPVDTDTLYRWLSGPSEDWETGLETTLQAYRAGLGSWLSLREPHSYLLLARDEAVERDLVPPLTVYVAQPRIVATRVLLGAGGLAALMRPPGQPLPQADVTDPFANDAPFQLFVRRFGPDPAPAQRLLEQIAAWQAAGRPMLEGLRVRAYARDADVAPAEGEVLIEKQWSRLLLDWPGS